MRYWNDYRRRPGRGYVSRIDKVMDGNYEKLLVEITARFQSTCRETGNHIRAGDRIAWLPNTGVVYCDKSSHFKRMRERRQVK